MDHTRLAGGAGGESCANPRPSAMAVCPGASAGNLACRMAAGEKERAERERIWLKNGGDPAMANLAFPPFSRRCKQPLEDADGAKGKECKRNKQRERREREGENAGLRKGVHVRICTCVCTSVCVCVQGKRVNPPPRTQGHIRQLTGGRHPRGHP